ncbi:unnamed protein product [Notodromas monacha]|uniref:EIF3j n=1 Tax=Notodromas monacha TaxID=399045 RepID=A0A7R9G9X4_9CRUS|nr:unnamed protein product [Notodromas monacha]CAG0914752.1 unnamed protein product [Notodromas monacha]
MASWDDEDFQPSLPAPKITDKWEGEDEEEVKDSWEDFGESAEKEPSGDNPPDKAAVEKKKKKKLASTIADREKKQISDLKKKEEESEEVDEKPLTEAQRIALEEERDLEIARETFGIEKDEDAWNVPLRTESDLQEFRKKLVAKLEKHTTPPSVYVAFLEDLVRDVCISLDMDDVKKLSATVNAVHNEKVNTAKAGGKAKKKKGRAVLNPGSRNVQDDDTAFYRGGGGYEDYDDFI